VGLSPASRPDFDRLYGVALCQEGHFTTEQAMEAGYSSQLLVKYLRSGKVRRVRRGIYRLKHFPPGQQEDLVAIWLWSEQTGVFSHETALMLHDLSDAMPARAHLTAPAKWRERRLRVPEGVTLHYADVRKMERTWIGVVPVTSVPRTLADCAADHLSPDLLSAAVDEALTRGVVAKREVAQVQRALHDAGAKARG
jgi:predicted transcriptional regulator of viral defense system